MCLEKTAVYLHGSFPCMCFVVDFLRLSGFDQALWILSNERITMLKATYLFIYLFYYIDFCLNLLCHFHGIILIYYLSACYN